MDYSHAAYFSGAQPYHFVGMPPLTPSHSTSGPSEDFNTTSPPEVYSEFQNDQYSTFDGYSAAPFSHAISTDHRPQQPASQVFPGPPTPPNNPAVHAHTHAAQVLNGAVPPHLGGGVAPAPQQQQQQPQQMSPQQPGMQPKEEHLDDHTQRADGQNRRGGSQSGEEGEELTPAQSKRKAQNRAAQRAFRERKERHVKDLEAKLASLEAAQQQAATENERLKRDLQKISTENEILRATSSMSAGGSPGGAGGGGANARQLTTGPMTYNPTDFYSDVLAGHENKTLTHRIVMSEAGERLYDAAATWDYVITHDLFKRGLVDIADISNRLKGQAKCDGQGPVFEERAIMEAIELSVASGSDSLL